MNKECIAEPTPLCNVEKPRRHFELPNWYFKFGVAELFKMYQELTK